MLEYVYCILKTNDIHQAMSVSETWYAVTDHGTNYCNLYNLIEGQFNISMTTLKLCIFKYISADLFSAQVVDLLKLQDIKRSQVISSALSVHLQIVLCINSVYVFFYIL